MGGADGDGMNKKKKQEMMECYRLGEWMSVPTDELVAGDVISLISPSIHSNQKKGSDGWRVYGNSDGMYNSNASHFLCCRH